MKTLKPLWTFVGKFFLIYLSLIALFLFGGLDKSYSRLFANVNDSVFRNFFNEAEIYAEPLEAEGLRDDVQFKIFNKNDIAKAKENARISNQKNVNIDGVLWSFNSVRVVLMPFLFLLSLILAYPHSIRRILVSIGSAFLCFLFFFFMYMMWALMFKMHENQTFFEGYQLSNFSANFIQKFVISSVETGFLFMFFIWAITTIRLEDFKKLL